LKEKWRVRIISCKHAVNTKLTSSEHEITEHTHANTKEGPVQKEVSAFPSKLTSFEHGNSIA
jgi:hypothetical protein